LRLPLNRRGNGGGRVDRGRIERGEEREGEGREWCGVKELSRKMRTSDYITTMIRYYASVQV